MNEAALFPEMITYYVLARLCEANISCDLASFSEVTTLCVASSFSDAAAFVRDPIFVRELHLMRQIAISCEPALYSKAATSD